MRTRLTAKLHVHAARARPPPPPHGACRRRREENLRLFAHFLYLFRQMFSIAASRLGSRAPMVGRVGVRTVIQGAGPFTPLVEVFRAPADSVWFKASAVPSVMTLHQKTGGHTFERFSNDQALNAGIFACFMFGLTYGILGGA
jgi:hypothetical protein